MYRWSDNDIRKFWTANTVILLVLAVIVGVYVISQKSEHQAGTIKLGAVYLLSGDFTAYGEQARNATNLAIADFKKAHTGTNVQVIYEDTRADPKQVLDSYQKLINVDNVDMVVGPMIQIEMTTLLPLVAQSGVPQVSIGTTRPQDRGKYYNPVVMWPDPTRETEQIAEYVYNQGVRSVGILSTRDTWESEISDAFARKFTELGGTVTAHEVTLPDTKDSRSAVTKVLASKPESLFFGTYYKFYDFVKNAKQLGFKGKMYSEEVDTHMVEETKGLSDGLQFISPNFYTTDFVTRYQAAYGDKPTLPAGQAYDATALALKLFVDNNGDRTAILNAMKNLKSYGGVSGQVTFDDTYRATFPLHIFEVQNGEINQIK